MSNIPVGVGRGEYSGECEIEFSREEYEKLNTALGGAGGFYNSPYVDVVASYGLTVRPIITGSMTVHFTERDFSGKKGAQRENQGRVGCPAGQQRYSGVLPENVLCCGCFILYTG